MTESVLLSALGGIARSALTVWLVEGLIAVAPAGLPRLQEIRVDGQVLAFTALVTLATAMLFGTVPAVQYSQADLSDAFKEGARGASSSRGIVRSALVVVEFALALVLLVGAALLVRSFWRLQNVAGASERSDATRA